MFFRFNRSSMTSLTYHTMNAVDEWWTGFCRGIEDTICNVITSACYLYPLLCSASAAWMGLGQPVGFRARRCGWREHASQVDKGVVEDIFRLCA